MSETNEKPQGNKKEFNGAQRDAIVKRGVNLLVSAGAGSGKTTVMIERIVGLLREGASLENMAICTFTNAAAAEMRARLTDKLLGEGGALKRQAALLSTAQIGTLHSFCMKIVRRAFYLCGLDPAFTVLEETEADALKAECAEEVINEAREAGDEKFMRLYAVFATPHSHADLKESLLKASDYASAQPNPEAWLMRGPQKTDAEYRRTVVAAQEKRIDAYADKLRNFGVELGAVAFAKDQAAVKSILAYAARYELYSPSVPTLSEKEKETHPEYAAYHERLKKYREKYNELIKQREKLANEEKTPSHERANELCEALGALGVQLLSRYAAAKKGRRKVDYADLEHYALYILSQEEGQAIADEYKHVFVDEYQDINPLQEQILNCFHGAMFFVGDVKQSIYGFRMCTPDFFVQKRDAYQRADQSDACALDLTVNYRSGKTVLDFVNEVFSQLMKRDFGGTDYASERMEAHATFDSSVSAILIQSDEKESEPPRGVYSVRREQGVSARPALRAEIREAVKEIERITAPKEVDGKLVRTPYGEIAVLVRSRNQFVSLLESALLSKGIPARFEGADTVADSFGAVNDLLAFLRLLDNAEDDVSLAAALLSRTYGGFTENDLAVVRRAGGGEFCARFYAYAKKGEDEGVRQKAATFALSLEKFRKRAAVLDIATLAGEITAAYDAFTVALGYGGEREAAALDAYIEYLSALTDYNTLHDYIVYLRMVGLPKLSAAASDNAVRIMTVHAAKGLEFPYVILANLEKEFNRLDTYARAVLDKEEGIVLRTYDFEKHTVLANPRYLVCSARAQRLIASEELRILYVAMTRAKVHLTLIAIEEEENDHKEADMNAFLDFLQPFMKKLPGCRRIRPNADEEETSGSDALELGDPDEALSKRLLEGFGAKAALRSGIVKASVSSVARKSEEAAQAQEDGEEQAEEAARKKPVLLSDDRSATARGTAYHLFMEHVRLGESGEWERLCARYPDEGTLVDRAEIEKAFAAVSAFIAGRPYYREQPFVYRAPANEVGLIGDFVLVQGVIDLLIEDGDGLVIVDYKTGAPKKEHLEVYERQLKLYATAAEKILGKKVRATYLYWFTSGDFMDPNKEKISQNSKKE